MEKDDKGSTMIRMVVSGWMFLLVPAYPGCPGSKAVKRSLLSFDTVVKVIEWASLLLKACLNVSPKAYVWETVEDENEGMMEVIVVIISSDV